MSDERQDHPETSRLRGVRRASRFAAGLGVVAIAAALFALPVRSWLRQESEIGDLKSRLGKATTSNNVVQDRIDRLSADEGIIAAARSELGYQQNGEEQMRVVIDPTQGALPAGWPFGTVEQILTVRTIAALQEAEAAAAAATTTTAGVAPATEALGP